MLKELHLQGIGPTSQIDLECNSRLNILTGDNGLGKTLLLNIIWWSITKKWPENPAIPQSKNARICYQFLTPKTNKIESIETEYDPSSLSWKSIPLKSIFSIRKTLAIYAQVDGSFSLFIPGNKNSNSRYINLSSAQVWDGSRTTKKILISGLISDLIKWQNQPDKSNFLLLSQILEKLSVADESIKIGEPTRVSLDDVRDIPTIQLPYETVPITHASAGIKRILSLAYILVWVQSENDAISKLLLQEPIKQIIFLMDETEAHLHPRWQRSILPAILTVLKDLKPIIDVQVFITTHSPLVLASIEPLFEEEEDKLFLFELNNNQVALDEIPWAKQGDVIGWLTSEIFGLKQARSKEAEQAIEAAQAWMRKDDMTRFPESLRTKEKIHQQLLKLLPGHDPFFPRWIVRMEADD